MTLNADGTHDRIVFMSSAHHVKSAAPSRFGEEVENNMAHPGDVVAQARFFILTVGRFERPIIEERAPHNVLSGYEAPET